MRVRADNRGTGHGPKLGAATSGWNGIGVGVEHDLAAIAIRTVRHASEPRYRAEDLVYEAWEAAGPRRAVLAREALALWPDCADGYVLLAQAASSLEEARELLERGVAAGERSVGRRVFVEDAGDFWLIFETRPYTRPRGARRDAVASGAPRGGGRASA